MKVHGATYMLAVLWTMLFPSTSPSFTYLRLLLSVVFLVLFRFPCSLRLAFSLFSHHCVIVLVLLHERVSCRVASGCLASPSTVLSIRPTPWRLAVVSACMLRSFVARLFSVLVSVALIFGLVSLCLSLLVRLIVPV